MNARFKFKALFMLSTVSIFPNLGVQHVQHMGTTHTLYAQRMLSHAQHIGITVHVHIQHLGIECTAHGSHMYST